MAIVGNLVQETSVTTGTGSLTTASVNGKRSFNTEFSNGATTDVFYYFVSHQSAAEWEYGTGHMSAATTLSRDTVIASSNANAAVNFSAGTKDVINDMPATGQMMQLNTGTASITVSHTDNGKIVELTGSTARTFTFTASANLGNGWWCITANNSTAELTLDGNGSELDALANYISYPGEVRLLQCTGSVINSTVLKPFDTKNRTATFTFTLPPGYTTLQGFVWGAGASGGKGATNGGGGGGGGGCTPFTISTATIGAAGTTVTCTVGAGGISQTTANTAGLAGNNSTFGSFATGYGGGRGGGGSAGGGGGGGGNLGKGGDSTTTTNGIGGTGYGQTTGLASTLGGAIYGGAAGNGNGGGFYGGAGGEPGNAASVGITYGAIYGGGAGGGADSATPGSGGTSQFAGAGGAGATGANNATGGTAPAGGGGGCVTGNSGAGGDGGFRIMGTA